MKKLALLLALLLAGCATPHPTQSQVEARRILQERDQTVRITRDCKARVESSDAWQSLGGKMAPAFGEPLLEQRLLETRPTARERASILSVQGELAGCRKRIIESAGAAHPSYAGVLADAYAESDAALVVLLKSGTWGQYAEARARIVAESNGRQRQVAQEIAADLKRGDAEELKRRQQAAASFRQWTYQQQVLNAMSGPKVTTCDVVGSLVTCSTY